VGGRCGHHVGVYDRHRGNLFKLMSDDYFSNCIDVRTDGRYGVGSQQHVEDTRGSVVLPIYFSINPVIF
jgi:hypothetical protein